MIRTISGLFDSVDDAQGAAKELMDRGVPRDQISVVTRGADEGGDLEQQHAVGESAGVSAMGGTVMGGTIGLLVGAGLLAIPGIGPVLAIGPLAAAIGSAAAAIGAGALGAGVGAGVGGLAGSLIGAGVPEEHAHLYAEGVRRGGTLLAVSIDSASAIPVDEVMRRYGVADIERRGAEWQVDREWRSDDSDIALPRADRDPSAQTKPDPAAPHVERDHRDAEAGEAWQDSSKMGTAAGAMTGAAAGGATGAIGGPAGALIGGAVGAVVGAGVGAAGDVAGERSIPADEYRGVNEYDEDTLSPRDMADEEGTSFADYESDFRSHFQRAQAGGQPYTYYEPAYRFGYRMAHDRRYPYGSWEVIEPDLRQDWEAGQVGAWDEFKSTVRYAWEKVHGIR